MYANYDSSKYVPPPKPLLNGGLYTGEPFVKGAPYANVPVVPDADYLTHYNLRSANPPIDALYQYPGSIRPGNNYQTMPGIMHTKNPYNLSLSSAPCQTANSCSCNRCQHFKYYYLS